MKKNLIVMAAFVMTAFVFTGCEKCMTCTYDIGGISTPTGGETCGSKSDLDDAEALLQATADSVPGTTLNCTRD